MLISTQVEVLVEVGVEQYVAVVEAGADLQYTFPDGLRTMADRRVEVIISQAEQGHTQVTSSPSSNWSQSIQQSSNLLDLFY